MRLKTIIPFIILAGIAGFLFWWFSDAQVIKRKTEDLAGIFTMSAADGKAIRVTKNNALANLLTADFTCQISAKGYSDSFNKDEIQQAHAYLSRGGNTSSVKVQKWELSEIADSTAKVKATFSVNAHIKNNSPQSETVNATIILLKSKQGTWMIRKIASDQE